VFAYTHKHACIYANTHTYARIYTRICMHIFIGKIIPTYTYTYTLTHRTAHVLTDTNTYAQTQLRGKHIRERSGRSRYGFATFDSHDNAVSAANRVNNSKFDPAQNMVMTCEIALKTSAVPKNKRYYTRALRVCVCVCLWFVPCISDPALCSRCATKPTMPTCLFIAAAQERRGVL
jgi:hypothetical protein